jgi:hypothetical protein
MVDSPDGRPAARRPLSITVAAAVFIVSGAIGLTYHATELAAAGPALNHVLWELVVRCLAIVAGVFLLRGADWARWLALAWTAYHVVLGGFHSVSQGVVHALILAGVAYVLLRAPARGYFRRAHGRAETV